MAFRAIRLTPSDSSKMYGRDGILAHSYLLGPNGQSNGCVSFSDYADLPGCLLAGRRQSTRRGGASRGCAFTEGIDGLALQHAEGYLPTILIIHAG